MTEADLARLIRDIPDFPKPGILFKDITPLLQDAEGLRTTIDLLAGKVAGEEVDYVAAIESRGFLFGAPLACKLGAGFVAIRKSGKLPFDTVSREYELEYGTDAVEVHVDAVKPRSRVVLVDDLLATGGTMSACCELMAGLEAKIVAVLFVIELGFLKGREKLGEQRVESLIRF